jgi:AhpD family alkylhydroperoxidase
MKREAREAYRAMAAFDRSVEADPRLRELIKIRASIVNGCAYCVDMHTFEARRAGESERRMHAVAAWRESPLFDARERAALALTDAVTRIADGGVPDDVYEAAAREFDPGELANLVMAIAAINSWNRIAVTAGSVFEPPSD